MAVFALAVGALILVLARRDGSSSSCQALAEDLGMNWNPEARYDRATCSHLRTQIRKLASRSSESTQRWAAQVLGQKARIMTEVALRLPTGRFDDLRTAHATPTRVPCAEGIVVTDEEWSHSGPGVLQITRPDRLFYQFEVSVLAIDENGSARALIRVTQDLDCDGEVAISEIEALVRPDLPAMNGAWTPTRRLFAPDFTE